MSPICRDTRGCTAQFSISENFESRIKSAFLFYSYFGYPNCTDCRRILMPSPSASDLSSLAASQVMATIELTQSRCAWGFNLRPAETKVIGRGYTMVIGVCARFSGFQDTINFDFSPKIDQDMAKHMKVMWGVVSYLRP